MKDYHLWENIFSTLSESIVRNIFAIIFKKQILETLFKSNSPIEFPTQNQE